MEAETDLQKFIRLFDAHYPAGKKYANKKGKVRKVDLTAIIKKLPAGSFDPSDYGQLKDDLRADGFFKLGGT